MASQRYSIHAAATPLQAVGATAIHYPAREIADSHRLGSVCHTVPRRTYARHHGRGHNLDTTLGHDSRPSIADAVTTALPSARASISPDSLTVATCASDTAQLTLLSVALSGVTAAVSCIVSPSVSSTSSDESTIVATRYIRGEALTVADALLATPSGVVTVTVTMTSRDA